MKKIGIMCSVHPKPVGKFSLDSSSSLEQTFRGEAYTAAAHRLNDDPPLARTGQGIRLHDLTQPWSRDTPSWLYFPDPVVTSFHRFHKDGLYSQKVETCMHTGTHIDSPLHFNPRGWDDASIPLDVLFGEGVIVDISDKVGPWDVIEPAHLEGKMDIEEGDILILHTGWHKYCYAEPEANEEIYFDKHPGPGREFADWAIKKKIKWIGMDTPAVEHPLNTAVRKYRPDLVEEFEGKKRAKIDKVLPPEDWLYVHKATSLQNIALAECLAGDITSLLNKRCHIGAFPWRFVGGEASICRVVAFTGI